MPQKGRYELLRTRSDAWHLSNAPEWTSADRTERIIDLARHVGLLYQSHWHFHDPLPGLELWKFDLLQRRSFQAAVCGCVAVKRDVRFVAIGSSAGLLLYSYHQIPYLTKVAPHHRDLNFWIQQPPLAVGDNGKLHTPSKHIYIILLLILLWPFANRKP